MLRLGRLVDALTCSCRLAHSSRAAGAFSSLSHSGRHSGRPRGEREPAETFTPGTRDPVEEFDVLFVFFKFLYELTG